MKYRFTLIAFSILSFSLLFSSITWGEPDALNFSEGGFQFITPAPKAIATDTSVQVSDQLNCIVKDESPLQIIKNTPKSFLWRFKSSQISTIRKQAMICELFGKYTVWFENINFELDTAPAIPEEPETRPTPPSIGKVASKAPALPPPPSAGGMPVPPPPPKGKTKLTQHAVRSLNANAYLLGTNFKKPYKFGPSFSIEAKLINNQLEIQSTISEIDTKLKAAIIHSDKGIAHVILGLYIDSKQGTIMAEHITCRFNNSDLGYRFIEANLSFITMAMNKGRSWHGDGNDSDSDDDDNPSPCGDGFSNWMARARSLGAFMTSHNYIPYRLEDTGYYYGPTRSPVINVFDDTPASTPIMVISDDEDDPIYSDDNSSLSTSESAFNTTTERPADERVRPPAPEAQQVKPDRLPGIFAAMIL